MDALLQTPSGHDANLRAGCRGTGAGFAVLKVSADEEQQVMPKFGVGGIRSVMPFSHSLIVAPRPGAMKARDIVASVKSHAVQHDRLDYRMILHTITESAARCAKYMAPAQTVHELWQRLPRIHRIDWHQKRRRRHGLVELCEFVHPADHIIADARDRADWSWFRLHSVRIY